MTNWSHGRCSCFLNQKIKKENELEIKKPLSERNHWSRKRQLNRVPCNSVPFLPTGTRWMSTEWVTLTLGRYPDRGAPAKDDSSRHPSACTWACAFARVARQVLGTCTEYEYVNRKWEDEILVLACEQIVFVWVIVSAYRRANERSTLAGGFLFSSFFKFPPRERERRKPNTCNTYLMVSCPRINYGDICLRVRS